ncbi:hypothetical protein HY643_02255 [Candidatus Woesearchaeota archaeon]|nr:hypothetical protein [Candidatus Woesearchaeota archaeon]
MGLENVFGTPEKVEPEKNLQVIVSDKSVQDKTLVELLAYFEQSIHLNAPSEEKFYTYRFDSQRFKIKPELISAVNENWDTKKFNWPAKAYFGIFLSALIQTSYNQGFNDFEFSIINADYFGAFLQTQQNKPIRIKAETIHGYWVLERANYCIAEIQNYQGDGFGLFMKNCKIYSPKQQVLDKIKVQVSHGVNNSFNFIK